MSLKKPQQVSNRTKPCPPKLERLFALANALPHDVEIPILDKKPSWSPTAENGKEWRRESDLMNIEKLETFLLKFPEEEFPVFHKFVGKIGVVDLGNIWDLRRELSKLAEVRRTLTRIAELQEGEWENIETFWGLQLKVSEPGPYVRGKKTLKRDFWFPTNGQLNDVVKVVLQDDGSIGLELPEILIALIDVAVEWNRIRRCEIESCQKLFWAGRIDKTCCSRKCTVLKNTRKWILNKEERNKKRRENRAYQRRVKRNAGRV